MDHVIRFEGIPMSKSMRGMCKEEDYAFLGEKEKRPKETETLGEDWKEDKVERVWRRRERAQQEEERLRELEESKKEKEQRWRHHVAELASTQEQRLRDRLARLRRFRIKVEPLQLIVSYEDKHGHTSGQHQRSRNTGLPEECARRGDVPPDRL
eukprot:XP_014040253.1 PREDICTED: golgin subfamily A member 6-like protein 22 isoform X1 [Salmo salar]